MTLRLLNNLFEIILSWLFKSVFPFYGKWNIFPLSTYEATSQSLDHRMYLDFNNHKPIDACYSAHIPVSG
jgi:hypothetical protein